MFVAVSGCFLVEIMVFGVWCDIWQFWGGLGCFHGP